MTLPELEARCRSILTRYKAGQHTDPTHSRAILVPANRATFRRLDDLAYAVSERSGMRVSARQLAALLLVEVLSTVEDVKP